MTEAEPIYVDLLREAERYISAGGLVDACRFLNLAADTMDGHPEQRRVRTWAKMVRSREYAQRAKALASRAMRVTLEPPSDLGPLEVMAT